MKKYWILVAVLLGLSGLACGDDGENSENGTIAIDEFRLDPHGNCPEPIEEGLYHCGINDTNLLTLRGSVQGGSLSEPPSCEVIVTILSGDVLIFVKKQPMTLVSSDGISFVAEGGLLTIEEGVGAAEVTAACQVVGAEDSRSLILYVS